MASRGPFGFRARHTEKEDKKAKTSLGLSRKPSITSNTPQSSKIPTQTPSFFSRSKQQKSKNESPVVPTQLPSNPPIGRGQTSVHITSTSSLPSITSKADSTRSAGLGISMENKTTQVNKSGRSRNVLRRKAPSIEPKSSFARTESSASSYDPPPSRQALEAQSSSEEPSDPFPNQILGVTAPPTTSGPSGATARAGLGPTHEFDTSNSRMARYNSRKTPSPSPHPTTVATYSSPNYTVDSGSSTRCSDSPSGLSHSSTPTSMTSQSPGISTPVSIPSARSGGQKHHGQTRPPPAFSNKRRQPIGLEPSSHGLAAVRESGTSSSSSSTVKASGSRDESSKPAISSPPVPPSPNTAGPRLQFSPMAISSASGQDPSRSKLGRQIPTNIAGTTSPQLGRGDAPPVRPSRDGVPSLDMNKLQLEFAIPRPAPKILGRSSSSASATSGQRPRLAAPAHIVTGKPSKMPNNQDLPKVETKSASARTVKDPSPQSALSARSTTSRFNLFSRRTRSPMESSAADATDRSAARKGPAAGTGHEGYGKYAKRGRSGSMSTSASRGRSTSSNSVGRTPSSRKSSLTSRDEDQIDDFYRSRLEPKKIIGGGQSAATSAHGSEAQRSSNIEPQTQDLPVSDQQMDESSTPAEPPKTHALRHVGRRLPDRDGQPEADSLGGEATAGAFYSGTGAPTLATRRSLHRSQLLKGPGPVKIPAPIDTRAIAPSPGLDSHNTYQSSMAQSDNTLPLTDDFSEGHEGNWLKPSNREKPAKSPKKWSFFHRSQVSPKKTANQATARTDLDKGPTELRAQVSRLPESRNFAFYEMMNPSEAGDADSGLPASAGQTFQASLQQGPISPISPALSTAEDGQQTLSMLLPSPPRLTGEFPDLPSQSTLVVPPQAMPSFTSPEPERPSHPPEPRKPRLQQIGRIPRVVSKRDRLHNPPPESFSRLRPYLPRPEGFSEAPASAPLISGTQSDVIEGRPILGVQTTVSATSMRNSQDSAKPASAPVGNVERYQKGRANDEFLVFPPRIGSHVSGSSSSGNLSVADITAVVPQPGAALTEEEEWNEYNDFLDIMESPAPLTHPKTNPYEKSLKAHGWVPAPLDIRKESSSGSSRGSSRQQQSSALPLATPPTRKLPSPPKKHKHPASPSRIDASKGSISSPQRKSLAASSRYSTSSIESEADSFVGRENPSQAKVAVPSHLRLELLTMSKLLSFDRVLFSPAHAEILGNRKSRILVLDGLGVDDWAFFCALEYPDAQISNLSATSRTAVLAKNYEHHYYPSLEGPFPFPQNYFTAAVLRFPVATTEGAYINVIKEFRRVLCPGGFLEISILDLDMVKMGNETRRSLRGLKERKQRLEPQTSLKPLSDNIQKMLGGKAFENLKQCMLEIPVASSSEGSRVRSFNEKMELLDEMPRDEDRTKHLPEIGRWWFSRCYEAGPYPAGTVSRSIWDDGSVLEECKTMETGFKMLLCYAQKPHKRRTLSL